MKVIRFRRRSARRLGVVRVLIAALASVALAAEAYAALEQLDGSPAAERPHHGTVARQSRH